MPPINRRLEFKRGTIKSLDKLEADYPSVTHSNTSITTAQDADVDTKNTALGGLRTTAGTDTNNDITAVQSSWPFANQAAFDSAMNTLKTTVLGRVNSVVLDAAGLKTLLASRLSTTPTIPDFQAAILADIADPQTCAKCGGAGCYAANTEEIAQKVYTRFDTSTDDIICSLCLGEGVTDGQYTVSIVEGRVTYVLV